MNLNLLALVCLTPYELDVRMLVCMSSTANKFYRGNIGSTTLMLLESSASSVTDNNKSECYGIGEEVVKVGHCMYSQFF